MMTNLFSTFDPATSMNLSMNWVSTILGIMIMPMMFWVLPNRYLNILQKINKMMNKEFNTLMSSESSGFSIMLTSLFMFIMLNNLMGLLPYVFTSSSHLSFTMTLAIPMWMGMMVYGWANSGEMMFAHLIPNGTPNMLMPFMVMIETTSNLIRPGSLAVRLTANMIAGHLLMSLLGDSLMTSKTIMPLIFIIQVMLMMFETAVSLIQAYVFSVLTTLYSSEVN
uniref:ATP synthase subunit a n=1 Tax=Dicyphus sp. TaxID=2931289 RepID=A0A8T9ZXX3_9HEMI|nr:ATPase subunit 6 [Dicyphus sp.]